LKTLIQAILGLTILVLAFLLVMTIVRPIRFNSEAEKRAKAVISRLTDIRKAQIAYKSIYGDFTPNFDSLINFALKDSFDIRKISGTYNSDEMNEQDAIESGLVSVSTTKMSVKDSLFSNVNIEMLRYVPYTDKKQFTMNAGTVETGSKVQVDVFEVYILYEILLQGLDRQLTDNYIEEKSMSSGFPGLRIGSMTEATNNSGNWE
jgi:hypothetical protein